MSQGSICRKSFHTFVIAGAVSAAFLFVSYVVDKTIQHDDEIEELFSRLEECEKNHESELKK